MKTTRLRSTFSLKKQPLFRQIQSPGQSQCVRACVCVCVCLVPKKIAGESQFLENSVARCPARRCSLESYILACYLSRDATVVTRTRSPRARVHSIISLSLSVCFFLSLSLSLSPAGLHDIYTCLCKLWSQNTRVAAGGCCCRWQLIFPFHSSSFSLSFSPSFSLSGLRCSLAVSLFEILSSSSSSSSSTSSSVVL